MVTSINNLLRLTSDLNSLSSKMAISHGDQSLDISSAAQVFIFYSHWCFSTSKYSISWHKLLFWWKYFFGCDAKEFLVKMLRSPNCIDGCKLVSRQPKSNSSIFRKGTWTYVCSHGIVMNEMEDSQFSSWFCWKISCSDSAFKMHQVKRQCCQR